MPRRSILSAAERETLLALPALHTEPVGSCGSLEILQVKEFLEVKE